MIIPHEILWLLLAAAVISGTGWFKFLYFISVGYGFSVAGCGAVMLVLFSGRMPPGCLLLCVLLIVYGCRLSGFLLFREIKSASYRFPL
ncbi:MAG: hypothetical protein IAA16_02735 [Candidatus Treponema excrementipullorum]|nr:hypothetical protein [Candidatus Treponema excrementipullorum]